MSIDRCLGHAIVTLAAAVAARLDLQRLRLSPAFGYPAAGAVPDPSGPSPAARAGARL